MTSDTQQVLAGYVHAVVARMAEEEARYASQTVLERQRQALLQYLSTPEGRRTLAASMVSPRRGPRDYHSATRRTLLVQELPPGALAVYDRDVDVGSLL